MNLLERRLQKLELTVKPCLMEQSCSDLERRYGIKSVRARAFAFLDRLVLKKAEEEGVSLIDIEGETLSTSELKARIKSLEWTELDDLAQAAYVQLIDYGRSVVRPSVPDSFLPLEPRNTENERKGLDLSYFIETDKQARRLWLEMMKAVEQIAAIHPC
jgi:hypothetical protein